MKKIILRNTELLSSTEMRQIIGAQIVNTSSDSRLACSGKQDGDSCSYRKLVSLSGTGGGPLQPNYIYVSGICRSGNCVLPTAP